jgi:[protein-PII] uridylyltransferase
VSLAGDTELLDLAAIQQHLSSGEPAMRVYRQALQHANAVLAERFHAGRSATELVHSYAEVIDELLCLAWQQWFEHTSDIALLAVGGYGRGELHPRSDIDVLILLQKQTNQYDADIGQFITFLWDIGLEVGQSVRTVDECVIEARNDITVATNLQEARLLIGPEALFEQQRQRCAPDQIWSSREFFSAKWREQIERHQKYNDTAYNLEPNIKEGPGGLRDIQMIGWVAKRHFNADTLHDLVTHEFLTEDEYKALMEGQAFLWQIRYGLHLLNQRREDRLLFDHQRQLAKQFGYRDTPKHLAVEQFMKRYYRTVMELNRLNEMLLQLFQENILYNDLEQEIKQLNNRFQSCNGFLEVINDNIFVHYPFAILEVFLLMAQHPELKGVRADTIRAIREHIHLIDAGFRADLRCRSLFMEILRQPYGITHELRRMNRYGVLAAYLPAFGNIVGQMQHDLFHVYTVDEHTLFVIRNLRRFTVKEFSHEFPLCSEIIQRIPKQELLIIAALFHDIAKGRGGDHSKLGAMDAEVFCRNHGLSSYDTKLVTWLIRQHLILSSTAQRQDISDPEVINNFANAVGDRNRLDYLYLLTVADIRGTSPSVWNTWKDALLKELYHSTQKALRKGLENPVLQSEIIADIKSEAHSKLDALDIVPDKINQLWARLGDEYFLRHSSDEVAWHTQSILDRADKSEAIVLVRPETRRGGTEVFLYTKEHDELFAQVTSSIEQMALTIADARILCSTDGYTLDTFIVLEENGQPLQDKHRIEELTEKLETLLHGDEAANLSVRRRLPRQTKHFTFPTDIQFWADDKYQRTAMQITAYDRPGLLSQIARAMQDCEVRLQNAKIATLGERAEDIFYLTDYHNQPLTSERQVCLQDTVLELLDAHAKQIAQ